MGAYSLTWGGATERDGPSDGGVRTNLVRGTRFRKEKKMVRTETVDGPGTSIDILPRPKGRARDVYQASRCFRNRNTWTGFMLEPANCSTGMILALADALPTFQIKGPVDSQKRLAIGSREIGRVVSKNESYPTTLSRLRHEEFTGCGTVNMDVACCEARPPTMPK